MGFLSSVVEFFNFLFEYIGNFITSTIRAFVMLNQVLGFPSFLIGLVPTFVGSCIVFVVAIAILKLIMGWSGE